MNLSEYLRELKDVKPGEAVEEVASSGRINAMQKLLRALVRGDNIVSGLNITKKSQDGWVIISGDQGGGTGGAAIKLPFHVSGTSRNGVLGVNIEPGTIAGLSPFVLDDVLGNVKLDNKPLKPILDIGNTNGVKPIVVRCDMTSPGPTVFQGMVITAATCQSSYNPDAAPVEIPGGGYTVFWDDTPTPPAPHTTGHFYLKLADVTVSGTTPSITKIEQKVFNNFQTFVLGGEAYVIPLPIL